MADALSAAKGVLHSADNLDKSVAKQAGHEYSAAPYEHAYKAKQAGTTVDTIKAKLKAPIEKAKKDIEDVEAPGTKQSIEFKENNQ